MHQEAQVHETEYRIEGMDCPSCAEKIKVALSKLKGVETVDVQFASEKLNLEYIPTLVSPTQIEKRVSDLGFRLASYEPTTEQDTKLSLFRHVWHHRRRNLTFLSAILFLIGFGLESQSVSGQIVRLVYIGALLSGGFYIVRSAISSIRYLSIDMSVLMGTAIIGALFIGEWSEAVMVTVLFSFAQFLETRSMAKARQAITALMNLTPPTVTVLRNNRPEVRPVKEITVGETIFVRPGECIPLDGVVAYGASYVNQSPITGESMPIEKQVDSEVYAGTLTENGSLGIRVTKAAEDTMLARITRQIEIAQSQKAKAQQFVDRFARVYTPCVIGLALILPVLAWLISGEALSIWIRRSLVLLVIACPCALAISTPVAVVSALACAARNGVLIKGGIYLEVLGKLKAIAFDKTGTLTQGKPEVTDIVPLNGFTSETVLQHAVAVEAESEHAIAHAILEHAKQMNVPIQTKGQFRALPGKGAEKTFDADEKYQRLIVGSPRLFAEYGTVLTKTEQARLHQLETEGKTIVLVGVDDSEEVCPVGMIALSDRVRPESQTALTALRHAGINHMTMLTGDTHRTAAKVAEGIDVSDYQYELLPQDKIHAVEHLRERHGEVGMVGDGINDAPALAAASVGIAMGKIGTDVTLEVADVVLIKDDLSALSFAVRLGRRTLKIIQTNIAFAIVIKLVFTLLAINGMATLWMAVFADMGASLLVIFNGLRLLKG